MVSLVLLQISFAVEAAVTAACKGTNRTLGHPSSNDHAKMILEMNKIFQLLLRCGGVDSWDSNALADPSRLNPTSLSLSNLSLFDSSS